MAAMADPPQMPVPALIRLLVFQLSPKAFPISAPSPKQVARVKTMTVRENLPPAAVIGLVLDNFMSAWENWQVVSAMLILYGVAFIVVESLHKETKIESMDDMTYKTALLIGLFQVLSIVPGTSRSGATILGAMLIGCSRSVAAEFSFFLAIPVMFGVSLLKVLKYGLAMPMQDVIVLLTGMVVAYIVSMLAIKFLMNYVRKHNFKSFGYYRIILGILVILYFSFIH